MSRWEPNARGRLEQAVLDRYRERGFDQVTVAGIAERAGLTERTFFRYFTGRREVLFWGQDQLCGLYASTIAAATIAFKSAWTRWAGDPGAPDLAPLIREVLAQLRAMATPAVVAAGR